VPCLDVKSACVSFGAAQAVTEVSVSVEAGEIVGVIGPNGAGKSTLLKSIAGQVRLDSGRVELGEKDVTRLSVARRSRRGIGTTFQLPRSHPELTVFEQLFAQSSSAMHIRMGKNRHNTLNRVYELAQQADLIGLLSSSTRVLTLGESRRFEVVRALINEPRVLLVDEPASGMTADEARLLAEMLRAAAKSGVAVLLIEHNIPFIRSLAEKLLVLDASRCIEWGPTEQALMSEQVKEAYLGRTTAP
jgi:ABC-type branched-subunit amino acid transport system ATPase component